MYVHTSNVCTYVCTYVRTYVRTYAVIMYVHTSNVCTYVCTYVCVFVTVLSLCTLKMVHYTTWQPAQHVSWGVSEWCMLEVPTKVLQCSQHVVGEVEGVQLVHGLQVLNPPDQILLKIPWQENILTYYVRILYTYIHIYVRICIQKVHIYKPGLRISYNFQINYQCIETD